MSKNFAILVSLIPMKKVWHYITFLLCFTTLTICFLLTSWAFKNGEGINSLRRNELDIEIDTVVNRIPERKFWRENRRRRPTFRNAVNGTELGLKDFASDTENDLSPMQRILAASGQTIFYINKSEFKEKHDFRKHLPPSFLNNFKNPCSYTNVSLGRHTRSPPIVKLRCLPYFMIVGFPKCGTTDLWWTLAKHPHVILSHPKEIDFFNKKQFATVDIEEALEAYKARLEYTSLKIARCASEKYPDYHPCITGDGSVDTIFDNKFWRQLPGNQLQTEPSLTNANYVHSINPNMKIIVLLRNPVERLYSDYVYMSPSIGYRTSPEDFHQTVVDSISNYTSCTRHRSQRACVYDMYNDWDIGSYKVRLKIGMYHIFLSDWLKVFPRKNVLVIQSEHTKGANRVRTLNKISTFLGIDTYSLKEMETLYSSQKMNQGSPKTARLLAKTRNILTDFYAQFNSELATLFPDIHY